MNMVTGVCAGALLLGTVIVPAAAASSHQQPGYWNQAAYNALMTWEKHPTAKNLDRLVTDGFHLPAKPDQADIGQLYADVNGEGVHSKYLTDDEQYVYEDLTDCSGC